MEKTKKKKFTKMAREIFVLILVNLFLFKPILFAEDTQDNATIVVTPTRYEETVKLSPNKLVVISEQDIEEVQASNLKEVLENVPGLFTAQNGQGGIVSVFARGLDSKYTVLMINGIKVYDPSSVNFGDASNIIPALNIKNIERIEILEGVSSSLYGANAIGSVINIIPKKPKKSQINIWMEMGYYDTFKSGFYQSIAKDGLSSWISLSKTKIDGFSKTKKEPDKDPYNNLNFQSGFVFQKDIIKTGATVISTKTKQNLDGWNKHEESDFFFFNHFVEGKFQSYSNPRLSWGYTSVNRDYDHGQSIYKGSVFALNLQNKIIITENANFVLGIDFNKETADIVASQPLNKDAFTYSPFVGFIYNKNKGYFKIGSRYFHHDISGDKVVWDIGGYYFVLKNLQFHFSVGTGFAVPSLYQLYDSFCGNRDLKPEKAFSYDGGISYYFGKNSVFDITYFYNKVKDKIDFDYLQWKYFNIAQTETSGLELSLKFAFLEAFKIGGFYNYLFSAKNKEGKPLLRRPKNQGGIRISCFYNRLNLTLEGRYVGPYKDFGDVDMKSFFVANFYSAYTISKNFQLKLKIKNLFDEKYEEVKGFNTERFSIYGGIEFTW